MNLGTVFGLILAVVSIIGTMILEGSNPAAFLQISALLIIFGGSFAATMISYDLKVVLAIPKFIMKAIFPPKVSIEKDIELLVNFAEKARRDGLLSLEEVTEEISDELLKSGISMVVDGVDRDLVESVCADLAMSMEKHEMESAEVFECLGGFSPTMGIVGTVMGLVKVLEGLASADMAALGEGIAVAFIATFYGIMFANLIWLPFANKMKYLNAQSKSRRDIVISGIMAIQEGVNPKLVKEKMISSIMEPELREQLRKLVGSES